MFACLHVCVSVIVFVWCCVVFVLESAFFSLWFPGKAKEPRQFTVCVCVFVGGRGICSVWRTHTHTHKHKTKVGISPLPPHVCSRTSSNVDHFNRWSVLG